MNGKPPQSPSARFLGGPALHPPPQGSRVVQVGGLPRTVPMLTVYPDGRVTPNSKAVTLLGGHKAKGICFHPPQSVRSGCTPQLWQVNAGECHLLRAAGHGGHIQLRAAGDCPPPGKYLFTPIADIPERYALVPTG
ncbi:hypothetical protein [Hymenobacter tenuis]